MPYGDAPVAGDSWRNTPYVVIQNAGSYIDTPQFLDTDHPIEKRSDAEAYLARLAQYPQRAGRRSRPDPRRREAAGWFRRGS